MKLNPPDIISTERASLMELALFKVYQTRNDYIKDYPEAANYTEEEWYNPLYPEKAWRDPDALSGDSEDGIITYRVAKVVNGEPKVSGITLSREFAARVNIPPKKAANEVPPSMIGKAVPTPIRKLHVDETLELGFGGIIYVVNKRIREANKEFKEGFLPEDRALLKSIYELLVELKNDKEN